MTISSGSLIQASDYNNIQSTVANILGSGSGQVGYGQAVTSSQISRNTSIRYTEWERLKTDILKVATHIGAVAAQESLIINLPTISAGQIINHLHVNSFSDAVNYLDDGASARKYNTIEYSDQFFSPDISSSRTTGWGSNPSILKHSFNVNFQSADDARYFFNSGGSIIFTASRTGGSAGSQNDDWTNLLTSVGTVLFDYTTTYKSPAGGVGATAIGFYDLTNSFQTVYSKSGTVYDSNTYTIQASCNIANNSNGGATQINFEITFTDLYSNQSYDYIDGTLSSNIKFRKSIGNVVVLEPTATNTQRLDDSSAQPASYSLVANNSSVNEGDSFTVTFTQVGGGSGPWPYTITGISSADINGASLTGNWTYSGQTITYNVTADQLTEGAETFRMQLDNTSVSTSVLINDTSTTVIAPQPTYSLVANNSSVNEGDSFTVTFTQANAGNPPWPYTITGISSADINGASLTGNWTYSGQTITYNVTADHLTEGTETFYMQLNNGGASTSVVINDTSTTVIGPQPSYSLASNTASVNEGDSFTVTFTQANAGNPPWAYTITGISSADINGASLTGNWTYSGQTITYNVTADNLTEGTETFYMQLNNGGASASVVINDTSTTVIAPQPTYSLVANNSIVNEGDSFTITFTQANAGNPPWAYTITGISSADINGASLTGNWTYSGQTITYNVTADNLTEGTETFRMQLDNTSVSTSVVINDTSLDLVTMDYLIVGGGAGGSTGTFYQTSYFQPVDEDHSIPEWITQDNYNGSLGFGGGGGRVVHGSTTLSFTTTYPLTVGAGGAGAGGSRIGSDGYPTTFLGQTAAGGVASFGSDNHLGIGATYSSFAIGGTPFAGGNAGTWSRFMEGCSTYGGDGSTWTVDKTVYFPQSANYDIIGSADDFGFVSIDGVEYDLAGFPTWNISTVYVTQGNHTVRSYVNNSGGYQTGIAFTITCQGQHYNTSGADTIYGKDGLDGINGSSGASGIAGTGSGGNGTVGFYYNNSVGGNGGSGCVAVRYPGSVIKFTGGYITVSDGYVHHVFINPGDDALRPISTSPQTPINFNISGPNVNLYNAAVAAQWDRFSPVVATVTGNIYGTHGNWALIIDGFPNGVTLINNNYIVGYGGNGGHGGDYTGYSGGENGEGGGPGLYIGSRNSGPVTIYNNGVIGGGGGGGGGAALYEHGYSCDGQSTTDYFAGDGGGGGAPYGTGGRGGSTAGSYDWTSGTGSRDDGDGGTSAGFTNPGIGGDYRTTGGNGGGIGQSGTNGGAGGGYGIGYGGPGGLAVRGVNRANWAVTGTILGGQDNDV